MLHISFDFDEEFCELYNNFCRSEKKKKFLEMTGIDRDKLDVSKLSKDYFNDDIQNVTIDANANADADEQKSPSSYMGQVIKPSMKLDGIYILWKYLKSRHGIDQANKLISKVLEGWYYIHDISGVGIQSPYCYAYSTLNIITDGRPYGQLKSIPPRKISSFIGQVIETTMDMSQQFMGAVAIADLFINYAWYSTKEIPCDSKIEDDFQRIVHVLNNPFRVSGQSPFTNVSIFCRESFKMLFKGYMYPDGVVGMDLMEETMRLQKIFLKFMAKKDPSTGFPYRFPIVTANINVDEETGKIKDPEFVKNFSKYNTEGVFNIFVTRGIGKIASCCRLLSNVDDMLNTTIDSFGNGGINVGSARVITLNLARIGKVADGDMNRYREVLEEQLDDIKILLDTHRYLLKKRIEKNYLKFFTIGWVDLDRHLYSTFGINGLYESIKYMGRDLTNDNNHGIQMAKDIMSMIREKVNEYIKMEGGKILYNIEQVPAEKVAITLAKKDAVFFNIPEDEYPFPMYANQFVPLWYNVDLWERAKLDGELSHHFTGGHISHLNIGSKVTPEQMRKLIKFAIDCKLEHFALNPVFSVCENEHTNLSNSDVCCVCGSRNVEKFTRIVGYFVPVSSWNPIRREWEFPKREFLNLGEGRTINKMKSGGKNEQDQ